MKWKGFFLLFALPFCLITTANGQRISFSVTNQPLEKVFLLIEQQSGYHFIYTSEQLTKAKPVTLAVSNELLTTVLDKCFAGQPLQYNINEKNITVKARQLTPSVRPLRGRIVDQYENPLKGATISIKNTLLVEVSDSNGEFAFAHIPPDATLIITSVEIKPLQRFVGTQQFIEISVDIKVGLLDETLVIAYGQTNRRITTGTISSVKAPLISRTPAADPLAALSGRVTGLQVTQHSGVPGSYMTVRLRGQNSIANGNDPLYIVDGVPFPSTSMSGVFGGGGGIVSSPLNTLNPNDIESIEILKDADVSAIYGSRGANGVILITTKKGRPGKARLDGHFYVGAGQNTRRIDMLHTADYIAMRREAFGNDGTTPNVSNGRDLLLWDTARYTDWQKKLIGNTMQVQNAGISYTGGSTNTQFRTALGYRRETTVYPGDFGLEKYSASTNISHRSNNNKFSLALASEFNHTQSKLPTTDLSSQITLSPNAPAIYNNNGKLNWENSTWTNPFASLEQLFTFTTDHFHSSLNLSYQLTPRLQARISTGFTSIRSSDHAITPGSSYDPAHNLQGQARFGQTNLRTIIAEPQLNYEIKSGNMKLNWLTGMTLQSSLQQGLYQAGTGYSSDDLLGSLRAASTIITVSETDIKYRYAGLFSRLSTTWHDRYLATLTLRRDGSSRYGESSRFANFGSVGAGWIFTSEPWIKRTKNKSLLSFGKLKASAGVTGNDQIGDYKYLDLFAPASNPYLGTTAFIPQQLYNPGYQWERVFKLESGLDIGLLANRFYLTLNYYHNITTNQLVSYSLPAMTGFNGILRNIPARIRNNGLEIELTANNITSGQWKWTSNFNLTFPRNKLLNYEGLATSSYANSYVIGHSLFIVKKYQVTGVDPATGVYTFTDFDNDGRITAPNDQQAIIFTGQQYFGGLENTITFRKISLSFLLQFVKQKQGANYLSRFAARPGSLGNQPVWVLDRWQRAGDIAAIQRFVNSNPEANTAYSNYLRSDAAYSDASFLRLRNLYLTIDLLSDKWKNKGIAEAKLLLQGHNLLTITRYKGLDPETKSLLPPVRMWTAGIQFSF